MIGEATQGTPVIPRGTLLDPICDPSRIPLRSSPRCVPLTLPQTRAHSGGRWPTATTAGCPPAASQPARKRGAARPFRRVDPSQGFRARNPAIAVSSADSAVCFHTLSRLGQQIQTDWTGSGSAVQRSRSRDWSTGASKQFPSTSWTNMLASSYGSRGRISGNRPRQAGRQAQIINFRAHADDTTCQPTCHLHVQRQTDPIWRGTYNRAGLAKKKSSKDTVLLASSYLGESLQGEGTYIDEKSFTLHKLR